MLRVFRTKGVRSLPKSVTMGQGDQGDTIGDMQQKALLSASSNSPNLEDPAFLETLPEPLKGFALGAICPPESIEGGTGTSSDGVASISSVVLLDELEISLRQEVLKRIRQGQDNVGEFWTDTTRMCWHMVFMSEHNARYKDLVSVRKLPILLLEDILDSSTLKKALEFYNTYAKPVFPLLFGDVLWCPNQKVRPCWLPFLKLATKFTKRLTSQPNTAVGNSVPSNQKMTEEDHSKYKDAVSSIMLTLCQIYPLSEKSATRVWGCYNDQAITVFEDRDEFEQEQAPMLNIGRVNSNNVNDDDDDGAEEDGAIPDYTVYESFWKLQQDLSRPNSVQLSDFLQRLRALMTTLEHTPVSNKNKKTSGNCDSTDISAIHDRTAASTSRYLTSSRLLSIQLQDADFRIPILSQVLIVCHHLIQISPVVLKAQLSDWQNRAYALLQNVSLEQYQLLQTILSTSEELWRQWKRNKCSPDLDQRKSEPLATATTDLTRKRKRSVMMKNGLSGDDDKGGSIGCKKISLATDLPKISRQMRQSAPSLQSHLEEYVDALDPESGIEAEYHPKNDALFSWRAMRLLSTQHLSDLHFLSKSGDFERVVRKVYPRDYDITIPGPMPAEEENEDINEEDNDKQEDSKEDHGKEEDNDEAMKDRDVEEPGEESSRKPVENAEKHEERPPEGEEQDVDMAEPPEKAETSAEGPLATALPEHSEEKHQEQKPHGDEAKREKDHGDASGNKDTTENAARPYEGPPEKSTHDATADNHTKDESAGDNPQRYIDFIPAPRRHTETATQQRRVEHNQPSRWGGGSDNKGTSRDEHHRSKRDVTDHHPAGGREDNNKYDRGGRGEEGRGRGSSRSTGDDRGDRDVGGGRSDTRHDDRHDRGDDHYRSGSGRSSDDRGGNARSSQNNDDRGGGRPPRGDEGTSRKPDSGGGGSRRDDRGGRPNSRGGGGQSDEDNRGGAGWSSSDRKQQDDPRSRGGGGGSSSSGHHERSGGAGEHRGGGSQSHSGGRHTSDDRGRGGGGTNRGEDRGDTRDRRGGDRWGGEDHSTGGAAAAGNRSEWRGGGDRTRNRGSGHRGDRRHRH